MITKSEEETRELARGLAKELKGGDVIALEGDLGAGKTTFVQGLALGLGVGVLPKSPTFVLMREYEGRLKLYHIDCYRLEDPKALLGLGLEDLFKDKNSVVAIEWADKVKELLPKNTIWVKIDSEGNNRNINIRGGDTVGSGAMLKMADNAKATKGPRDLSERVDEFLYRK